MVDQNQQSGLALIVFLFFQGTFVLIKFVCALCLNYITVKMTRQKGWQWHRGIDTQGRQHTGWGKESRRQGDKAMGRKGGG